MRTLIFVMSLTLAGQTLAQPLQVVADTPVTASLVQQVMGDLGQVQVLLPQGTSAHHHQMRPSDARALQDAELLVWTGPALTPWLDRAAAVVGDDVTQLRLIEVPGTHLRSFGDNHAHDHDHGHDHEHHHDADDVDPHAWLDPDNARHWLAAIADTLGVIEPENAPTYARNAATAGERIAVLDGRIRSDLAPHAGDSIVVFHDAYGYLTEHFGLKPAIAVSLGDASTPSAAHLRQVRARIAQTGASCAFPEYGSDARLIHAVIDGGPVRLGGALMPEGGDLPAGPQLYEDLMTGLANTIRQCLDR